MSDSAEPADEADVTETPAAGEAVLEGAVLDEGEPAESVAAEPASADEIEDTKRKFRAALDRKKQAHAAGAAAAASRTGGKAQGAGGPATSRRQFRRKSG